MLCQLSMLALYAWIISYTQFHLFGYVSYYARMLVVQKGQDRVALNVERKYHKAIFRHRDFIPKHLVFTQTLQVVGTVIFFSPRFFYIHKNLHPQSFSVPDNIPHQFQDVGALVHLAEECQHIAKVHHPTESLVK